MFAPSGDPVFCCLRVSLVCHRLFRTFAVLNARRPAVEKEKEEKVERRRPDWMPPPKVFPFIWITIGILRAVSTTMASVLHGEKDAISPVSWHTTHNSRAY